VLSQLQSDAAAFAASTGTATAQAQAAFDGLKGSLGVVCELSKGEAPCTSLAGS
jgi:hypothetical protein